MDLEQFQTKIKDISFENGNSIWMLLYSNDYLRVDLGLSNWEYQVRNGILHEVDSPTDEKMLPIAVKKMAGNKMVTFTGFSLNVFEIS